MSHNLNALKGEYIRGLLYRLLRRIQEFRLWFISN